MRSIILVVVLGLICSACAGLRAEPQCEAPPGGAGNATAEGVVRRSAVAWALSPDSGSAVAPCGDGASCRAIAQYARSIGGRIASAHPYGCAVFWYPPAVAR